MKTIPDKTIARWSRWLGWTFPLLAWPFRRWAIRQLADHREHTVTIHHLVPALDSPDQKVAAEALAALRSLSASGAVNTFCALWAKHRDERLAAILIERDYVATQPLELQALTALKANHRVDTADGRAVSFLAQLLADADAVVRTRAEDGLRSLAAPAAVDTLCALWAKQRDAALGEIVARCRYQARQPTDVRVLSWLKAGRIKELQGEAADGVACLAAALADRDNNIASNAKVALSSLNTPAAVDALMDLVLEQPDHASLVPIINQCAYRHSVEGRWFLYLAMAGRFDDYLAADFEFQVLRQEFAAAPAVLQARIRESMVKSGDVRMNALFVTERKEKLLADLSDHDADVLVRINSRNKNWDELFKFFWVLPARHVAAAVRAMAEAQWQPDDPDRVALFQRLAGLTGTAGDAPQTGRATPALPPILQQWLGSDESGTLAETTPPPQQIAALGALRKQGKLDGNTLDAAAQSPHWLVRMAAGALGGQIKKVNDGGCEWFDRLAVVLDADKLWGLKPCQVKRDGLEALQEGLARMPDRKTAGGLNLVEAVVAHYTAHDIEIEVGAHVVIKEDSFEVQS